MDPLARLLGLRPGEHRVRWQEERAIAMRDGVRLRTWRLAPIGGGQHPTLLIRTPYGIGWNLPMPIMPFLARLFATRGYQVVLQDTRGRYGSDGEFYPFVHERRDGQDTLAWIEGQPWFDGRLGMWGASYFGYTQWSLADGAPAYLKALVPFITTADFHSFFYPGGAFSLISALRWASGNGGRRGNYARPSRVLAAARTRPLRDAVRVAGQRAAFFDDWVDHPDRDDYWAAIDHLSVRTTNRVPVLSIAGLYDIFCGPQLEDYSAMRTTTNLEIGPYAHGSHALSPRRLGWTQAGPIHFMRSSLAFLDHHLQGRDLVRAPVERYVVGQDRWCEEASWPPPAAQPLRFHLHAGGRLLRDEPAADAPPSHFVHDPEAPVPSRGGSFLGPKCGLADQRPLGARRDVLCFDTPPLARALHLAGPVTARLVCESSAPATDFTAKLVWLPSAASRPALNLCDGIRRVPQMQSGPQEIAIDLWSASAVIPAGDRLRVEIASSNFPRYDAHPGVPGNPGHARSWQRAEQTLHHAADRPSHVEVHTLA